MGVAEGTGVSVRVSVGVGEAVSVGEAVAVGTTGVREAAGGCVPAGARDDGKIQANKVVLNSMEKRNLSLIGEVCNPFRDRSGS